MRIDFKGSVKEDRRKRIQQADRKGAKRSLGRSFQEILEQEMSAKGNGGRKAFSY